MQTVFNEKKLEQMREKAFFLYKNVDTLALTKPLKNIKVLHCSPVTYELLCKIEPLLIAGANLLVASCPGIIPNHDVETILSKYAISYEPNYKKINGEFDVFLDCGGFLRKIGKPKMGTVELTMLGSEKYRLLSNYEYPIITVDNTQIKTIECKYGTGEAFIRAFEQITHNNIDNQKFVIFGGGKVGGGIAHHLLKKSKNIFLIDFPEKLPKEKFNGLSYIDASDVEKIKTVLQNAFCTVMATGIKNLISTHYNFTLEDFKNSYLVDMGGGDEFGENFPADKILGNKLPINFLLEHPTLMEYIDPVFYAHNYGAILLQQDEFKSPGFYNFPKNIDEEISMTWKSSHLNFIL